MGGGQRTRGWGWMVCRGALKVGRERRNWAEVVHCRVRASQSGRWACCGSAGADGAGWGADGAVLRLRWSTIAEETQVGSGDGGGIWMCEVHRGCWANKGIVKWRARCTGRCG